MLCTNHAKYYIFKKYNYCRFKYYTSKIYRVSFHRKTHKSLFVTLCCVMCYWFAKSYKQFNALVKQRLHEESFALITRYNHYHNFINQGIFYENIFLILILVDIIILTTLETLQRIFYSYSLWSVFRHYEKYYF